VILIVNGLFLTGDYSGFGLAGAGAGAAAPGGTTLFNLILEFSTSSPSLILDDPDLARACGSYLTLTSTSI
jgi:hypothetical protein